MTQPSIDLSRQTLVSFALELADGEGLEAVTFRRLAEHFGVTPMALYHHIGDKAHLLAEMSEAFLSEVEVPTPSRAWARDLRHLLLSYVAARGHHPCGPELMQEARSDAPHANRLSESILGILARAGFGSTDAGRILQQLTALLTSRFTLSAPDARVPFGTVDDLGVEMLVLGIETLARRQRGQRSADRGRRPR